MTAADYEANVAALIAKGIKDGSHGLNPECANTRIKPQYFSRDRGTNIEFDVSVEVMRTGAKEPFFLWVIECKHYRHNVPVDDAEEFFSKLQQISGANLKGTIVSKKGFASGTVAFCRSKGIGLWKYHPFGEPAYVVQADTARERAIISGMTELSHFLPQFYGLATNGHLTNVLEEMVVGELSEIPRPPSATGVSPVRSRGCGRRRL